MRSIVNGNKMQTKQSAIEDLNILSDKCLRHAQTCRECFYPIMDEEGNPQYESEACSKGSELLKAYNKLEAMYFGMEK
jgi:hypothetical protein